MSVLDNVSFSVVVTWLKIGCNLPMTFTCFNISQTHTHINTHEYTYRWSLHMSWWWIVFKSIYVYCFYFCFACLLINTFFFVSDTFLCHSFVYEFFFLSFSLLSYFRRKKINWYFCFYVNLFDSISIFFCINSESMQNATHWTLSMIHSIE